MMRDTAPTLSDGNKLYLYRLLKEAIGCGKQTFLPRVEEALAAEQLTGEDIGFASTRALMEALEGVVTLTVFKGGRVYVTLNALPEWDAMLEAPEETKPAKGNKPWKRKKGARIKPVRPKRVPAAVPVEETAEPAEEAPTVAEETAPAADVKVEPEPPAEEPPAGALSEEVTARNTEEAPADLVVTTAHHDVETEEEREGQNAGREGRPEPQPLEETPLESEAPAPEQPEEPTAPRSTEEPAISLTITYDPHAEAEAEAEPEREPPARTSAAPRASYPRDFATDVYVPNILFAELARIMPLHADVLGILTEDFRLARSLGTAQGTRSQATFPLRYTADGTIPIAVRIKRNVGSGAPWTVARIDGATDEALASAGIDGLPILPDALPGGDLHQLAMQVRLDVEALQPLLDRACPAVWSVATLRQQLAFAWAAGGERDVFATGLFDETGAGIAVRLNAGNEDFPKVLVVE